MRYKLISWNVNGFRACLQKGFPEFFAAAGADVVALQEIKMTEGQACFEPEGYAVFYHSAEKKGYSGTAAFTRLRPAAVYRGIGGEADPEGRVLTLEFDAFYLVNYYAPNVQHTLARLAYRLDFDRRVRAYLAALDREKPVLLCGDLNVAHKEIDLRNPKTNIGNAGFTPEERASFSELLESGFIDSFRFLYPALEGAYSWWSYRFDARVRNIGWRIDYFVVSSRVADSIRVSRLYTDVTGSDHCPVGLEIEL